MGCLTEGHTPAGSLAPRPSRAALPIDPSCRRGRCGRTRRSDAHSERTLFGQPLLLQSLQPPYRVVPDEHAVRADAECRRSKAFRQHNAPRLREAIQRTAARVKGKPRRTANDDPVDTRWELRGSAAEQTEAEKAAEETARHRLSKRLRSLDHPHPLGRRVGDGEGPRGEGG